jgi:hypothetical protein
MKTSLFLLILMLSIPNLYAKKDLEAIAAAIVMEGKTLYNIDMASWHGTDVMNEKFEGNKDDIGGYFSYMENEKSYCVFYSKYDFGKVVFEVSYVNAYQEDKVSYNSQVRPFNAKEHELYVMRDKTMQLMQTDTLFKFYKNTSPNLIPLIYNGERKVYVITGTSLNGIVPLGNDYLISFDKNGNIKKTIKIHKNLIPIENENGDTAITTMHSHLTTTGDFITPTDICTIMEYEKLEK